MHRLMMAGILLGVAGCASVNTAPTVPPPAVSQPTAPPDAAPATPAATPAPAPAPAPTPAPTPAPATATVGASTATAKSPSSASRPTPAAAAASRSPPAAPAPHVSPAVPAEPPARAVAPPPAAPAAQPQPTLNLAELEQRLRDTRAIGLMTKLSLKNQVDDLLNAFRALYKGPSKRPPPELRQRFDLLLLKVLSLLQDGDPPLAAAVASSREAIWNILADPAEFAKI
jgi:hypothetical protein